MNNSILIKTLDQIISDYGKNVLSNGTQVINLFADYCPGEINEKAKLKKAYDSGVIQELIKSTTGNKDASAAVNKAIQDLKDRAFMDEAIAAEFVYEIAEVLKLKYTPRAASTNTTTNTTTSIATNIPANSYSKNHNQTTAVLKSAPSKRSNVNVQNKSKDDKKRIIKKVSTALTYVFFILFVVLHIINVEDINGLFSGGDFNVFEYCWGEYFIFLLMSISLGCRIESSNTVDKDSDKVFTFIMVSIIALPIIGALGWGVGMLVCALRLLPVVLIGFLSLRLGTPIVNFIVSKAQFNKKTFIVMGTSLLLTILLVVFSFNFETISKNKNGGFIFELSEDKSYYILTGYQGSKTTIEIPSKHMGKPVKVIGVSAFEYHAGTGTMISITIPDSVITIEDDAFSCTSITSISIPDSVITIGDSAFYSCGSLTDVTIGSSVTTIGNAAFDECKSLQSVTFKEESQLTSIGEYAFRGASFSTISIPESVTSIGRAAFVGCDSLTRVVIPKSVETMGMNVFYASDFVKIYCEAKDKPDGWDPYWNSEDRPVVWGYTNE